MGQNGSDVSEDGSVYTLNALDVPAALVPSANPEGGSSCDPTQFECGGAARRRQGTPRAGGGERHLGDG